MDHAEVDAILIPPDTQQQAVVAFPVEDELTLDLPVSIRISGILRENVLD